MNIVLQIQGANNFQILYGASGNQSGLSVIGYLIYPNRSKSAEVVFDELGDGVYAAIFPYERKTKDLFEKYGLVVKEDGIPRQFGMIQVIN